jgi:hypothetical protein
MLRSRKPMAFASDNRKGYENGRRYQKRGEVVCLRAAYFLLNDLGKMPVWDCYLFLLSINLW